MKSLIAAVIAGLFAVSAFANASKPAAGAKPASAAKPAASAKK